VKQQSERDAAKKCVCVLPFHCRITQSPSSRTVHDGYGKEKEGRVLMDGSGKGACPDGSVEECY